MSTRKLVRPLFPSAPREYEQTYFSSVVQAFAVYLDQVINPGALRGTELTLTNLQTNDSGLEVGAIFQQDGVLKITLSHKPHPAGVAASSAVGTVTVTTT